MNNCKSKTVIVSGITTPGSIDIVASSSGTTVKIGNINDIQFNVTNPFSRMDLNKNNGFDKDSIDKLYNQSVEKQMNEAEIKMKSFDDFLKKNLAENYTMMSTSDISKSKNNVSDQPEEMPLLVIKGKEIHQFTIKNTDKNASVTIPDGTIIDIDLDDFTLEINGKKYDYSNLQNENWSGGKFFGPAAFWNISGKYQSSFFQSGGGQFKCVCSGTEDCVVLGIRKENFSRQW